MSEPTSLIVNNLYYAQKDGCPRHNPEGGTICYRCVEEAVEAARRQGQVEGALGQHKDDVGYVTAMANFCSLDKDRKLLMIVADDLAKQPLVATGAEELDRLLASTRASLLDDLVEIMGAFENAPTTIRQMIDYCRRRGDDERHKAAVPRHAGSTEGTE